MTRDPRKFVGNVLRLSGTSGREGPEQIKQLYIVNSFSYLSFSTYLSLSVILPLRRRPTPSLSNGSNGSLSSTLADISSILGESSSLFPQHYLASTASTRDSPIKWTLRCPAARISRRCNQSGRRSRQFPRARALGRKLPRSGRACQQPPSIMPLPPTVPPRAMTAV